MRTVVINQNGKFVDGKENIEKITHMANSELAYVEIGERVVVPVFDEVVDDVRIITVEVKAA